MSTLLKVLCSVVIILAAVAIGKKIPSLGGLISVMPLAGVLVMIFLYSDTGGDPEIMKEYTKGALWGILPSILFYVAALWGFSKQFSLPVILGMSFAVWIVSALCHQWLMKIIR
jgi:uncharacterized membrane protein (GlpM family)